MCRRCLPLPPFPFPFPALLISYLSWPSTAPKQLPLHLLAPGPIVVAFLPGGISRLAAAAAGNPLRRRCSISSPALLAHARRHCSVDAAHNYRISLLRTAACRPVLDFSDLLYESERQQLRLTGPSPTLELSAAVAGAAPAAAAAVASAAPKKLTWREKAQQEQEAKAARAAQQGSSAAPGRR